MLSIFSESGDADGTSGVRNLKPRYLVVRFIEFGVVLNFLVARNS